MLDYSTLTEISFKKQLRSLQKVLRLRMIIHMRI